MFANIALAGLGLAAPAAAQEAVLQDPIEIAVGLEGGKIMVFSPLLPPSPSCAIDTTGYTLAHLDRVIAQLQENINALRTASKATAHEPLRWHVATAQPSHLYHATHILLAKTSRLAAERIDARFIVPNAEPVDEAITLDIVVDSVKRANDQLCQTLDRVGVTTGAIAFDAPLATDQPSGQHVAGDAPPTAQSAALLMRLLTTSQQMDTVLLDRWQFSDIYDRIEQALLHVGRLTRRPLPPLPNDRFTSMSDLYLRIFRCLRLSQVLEVEYNVRTNRRQKFALSEWQGPSQARNTPSLQITSTRTADLASVGHTHVYDLTTLVIAHLAGLGDGSLNRVRTATYTRPSRIGPTDAYRLAGALESQLARMTGIAWR